MVGKLAGLLPYRVDETVHLPRDVLSGALDQIEVHHQGGQNGVLLLQLIPGAPDLVGERPEVLLSRTLEELNERLLLLELLAHHPAQQPRQDVHGPHGDLGRDRGVKGNVVDVEEVAVAVDEVVSHVHVGLPELGETLRARFALLEPQHEPITLVVFRWPCCRAFATVTPAEGVMLAPLAPGLILPFRRSEFQRPLGPRGP